MTSVTDFSAALATGENQNLSEFSGKVLLIVNTASKCGFTPQYTGLERLHQTFSARGSPYSPSHAISLADRNRARKRFGPSAILTIKPASLCSAK